jgi:polyketide cyclase/dehydrase/lipid transport protein
MEMKNVILIFTAVLLTGSALSAQNLNASNGGYESKRVIDGKKFRVMYYEYEIDKTPDEVWAEVAGNYVSVGEIAKSISESYCESGDTTEGLGAARFCNIEFGGKEIKIKERITDWNEGEDRMEYSYDVYESEGFPAKVYNTWIVRKGDDGKTYLANVFVFRAKPGFATGFMKKKLTKLKAQRNSVLTYKHYLETGEKNADPEIFDALYPEPVT